MAAVCDIGLVGLAVMGQNLALNIASKGYNIAVTNRSPVRVDDAVKRAKEEGNLPLHGYKDTKEFVLALKKPRIIIMLVQAGEATQATIDSLVPLLEQNDILIDGGNEWYENTESRARVLEPKGIRYIGMGVSGGEEGARNGPALMPGGNADAVAAVMPILKKIAAQADGPCVSYIGPGGAGHYVKMAHNGIEYGDMQLICEAYHYMRRLLQMNNDQIHEVFKRWNTEELDSFLIEITSKILKQSDPLKPEARLIDSIDDVVGAKGTGLWTVKEAATRGVPCPTIQAALDSRNLSAFKTERHAAFKVYPTTSTPILSDKQGEVDQLKNALYCSKICSYAQGMKLLHHMSRQSQWNLNLGDIARGWKGGCIIRARFLDLIKAAYQANAELESLLLNDHFAKEVANREASWRHVVTLAATHGVAMPAMSASLCYFDAYRTTRLPTNLVSAQRDYFGAHQYERVDQPGRFHTTWQ